MQAFQSGFIQAQLALVATNRAAAPVLQKAIERGYPTAVVPDADCDRSAHEAALLATLQAYGVEHLLLAGYMRILSPTFLRQFSGAILNIHPSLLPDFPGLHAARRQWEAGRKVVGATVHHVDAGVDTGPHVLQGSLVTRGDEDAEALADRLLLEVEHVIYPRAVCLFLDRLKTHA